MKILWTVAAWDEYLHWQVNDRAILKRINALILDIGRNGSASGIGKPELLRGPLSGWASRRINDEHRLVYRVRDDILEIAACRGHY